MRVVLWIFGILAVLFVPEIIIQRNQPTEYVLVEPVKAAPKVDNSVPPEPVAKSLLCQPLTAASVRAAKKAGRPMLVLYTTDSCGPCNKMKREVFESPAAIVSLSGFTLFEVNATKRPDQARRAGVTLYPTIILYDRQANARAWHMGAMDLEKFLVFLEQHRSAITQRRLR